MIIIPTTVTCIKTFLYNATAKLNPTLRTGWNDVELITKMREYPCQVTNKAHYDVLVADGFNVSMK